MVAPATLASLRVYVAGIPARPAGNETGLVVAVRSRLNNECLGFAQSANAVSAFVDGTAPIVSYLTICAAASTWVRMGKTAFALHVRAFSYYCHSH